MDWPVNNSGNVTSRAVTLAAVDIVIIIACSVLIACAFLGNLLVIVSVATNRRLRTVTNCYVVSLAAADALVAVLVMPLAVAEDVTKQWLFGRFMCDLYTSLDVMLCTASIMNLCCISIDRYFAITAPLVYVTKRSQKLAITMVTVAWLLSAAIVLPAVVGWKDEDYGRDASVCYIPRAPGYVVYSACGSFFIPLVVMLYVYYRIFRIASERERNLAPYKRYLSRTHSGARPDGSFADSGEERNPSSSDNAQSEVCIEIKRHLQAKLSEDLRAHCVRSVFRRAAKGRHKKQKSPTTCAESPTVVAMVTRVGGPTSSALAVRRTSSTPNLPPQRKRVLCGTLSAGVSTPTLASPASLRRAAAPRPPAADTSPYTETGSFQRPVAVRKTSEQPSAAEQDLRPDAQRGIDSGHSSMPRTDPAQCNARLDVGHVRLDAVKCNTRLDVGQSGARLDVGQYGSNGRTSPRGSDAELRLDKPKAKESAIFRKESKAAKTLAIVVGGFTVCWLPFFLLYIVSPFCGCDVPDGLVRVCVWTGYFNSVCNPAIYALYNRTFRHSFWRLTCGLLARKQQRGRSDELAATPRYRISHDNTL